MESFSDAGEYSEVEVSDETPETSEPSEEAMEQDSEELEQPPETQDEPSESEPSGDADDVDDTPDEQPLPEQPENEQPQEQALEEMSNEAETDNNPLEAEQSEDAEEVPSSETDTEKDLDEEPLDASREDADSKSEENGELQPDTDDAPLTEEQPDSTGEAEESPDKESDTDRLDKNELENPDDEDAPHMKDGDGLENETPPESDLPEETKKSETIAPEDNRDVETYPCKRMENGEAHYYDSNGNLYRVGDELCPNSTYELNGYKYETDDKGRIISAEGDLHMKGDRDHLPIKDSMDKIGKGDQMTGDDRGHLIGDQFDGYNDMGNLVPQDSGINRVDYRNFENELAKAVRDGNDVHMQVEPIYDGDSRRPTDLLVNYSINGQEYVKIFPNE